jgi:hypothetical protein
MQKPVRQAYSHMTVAEEGPDEESLASHERTVGGRDYWFACSIAIVTVLLFAFYHLRRHLYGDTVPLEYAAALAPSAAELSGWRLGGIPENDLSRSPSYSEVALGRACSLLFSSRWSLS